ncbi:hypothetical protein FRC02_003105 [Tulasnella sp. 418]|nr:hypothetical protein FRC02_003105 [Tulasnella sp. 418]
MPSRDTDPVTDPSRENTPELHINDFMTNDGSSELSSMYEADLSSHAASVAWPRRPLDIEEYRPPSVYSFHESLMDERSTPRTDLIAYQRSVLYE